MQSTQGMVTRFKNKANGGEGSYESIGQFRMPPNISTGDLKKSSVGFSLDPPQEVEDCEACHSGLLGIHMVECPECGGPNKRNVLACKLREILPFSSPRADILAIHHFLIDNPRFVELLQSLPKDQTENGIERVERFVCELAENSDLTFNLHEDALLDCLQFFGLVDEHLKDKLQTGDIDPRFLVEIRSKIAEYRCSEQLFELVCWINENHLQMQQDHEPGSAVNFQSY